MDEAAFLKQIDEELNILVLVTGQLGNGCDHYAYVSIPPSKYHAFKRAETKGDYNLAEFGTILFHADGKEPSATVKKEMEEKYGVDHQFEETVRAAEKQLTETVLASQKSKG